MTNSAPSPGALLGNKYRVVRLIGEGGMGAVYEAVHEFTEKRVAIKWLHPHLTASEQAVERFLREAKAAARVRHPNVVDVYDVAHEHGTAFLVMEYLEGEPLSALLELGGVPMHEAIALLLPAMRAVAAAHRQGIVHRDIKPENLFLATLEDRAAPVLKVLDFGISKLSPRGGEQLALTKTGSTLGTPMYMSFEQLSGAKDVDARADIYAFGVILYEVLTGRAPYEAESFTELVVKVATTTPASPKELRADIPTALARVVQWAMAKDRDQRILSMEALVRELEPFSTRDGFQSEMTLAGRSVPLLTPRELTPSSHEARPPVPLLQTAPRLGRARRHRSQVAAAAAALLLSVLTLWLWPRSGSEPGLPSPVPKAPTGREPQAVQAAPPQPPTIDIAVKEPVHSAAESPAAPPPTKPVAAAAIPTPVAKQQKASPPRAAPALKAPTRADAGSSQAPPPAASTKPEREPKPNFRVRNLPKSADF